MSKNSQAILNDADKRSYARVPSYFQASYRRLSSPDEPQLCPRQQFVEDARGLVTELNATGSKIPESLIRFLVSMDSKLDGIMAMLRKDNLNDFFPNKLAVVDVSASGVLVQSDELEVDEYIELVMYLGEFPPRVASAIGRVIRPGQAKFQEGRYFAVQFTSIRDSDREELVRYVFKEERERIRSEKLK